MNDSKQNSKGELEISVIVPVYNPGKYFKECVDSIISQTFKSFELLLIDDGSTDGSSVLCDDFAKKDKRIRVIHKDNEGINATRLRGVHEAKGEWVVFVDDDDILTVDALESLYNLHENADIVIGYSVLPSHRLPEDASIDDYRRELLGDGIQGTPWAKLYKRNLLTDDVFDFPREIDGEEDMIMNTRLFFKQSVKIKILYKLIYNNRHNPNSKSATKVRSIHHEEAFYKALYNAIPENERTKYMKRITFMKLNGLYFLAYQNPKALVDKTIKYYAQLKDEAKACRYKVSLGEWVLLNSSSTILLKLVSFCRLAYLSISYRFKLRFQRINS